MQAALKALAAAAALRARFAGSARACTAYVTNERNNTVSVVDLDQIRTAKAVLVGQHPHGITTWILNLRISDDS